MEKGNITVPALLGILFIGLKLTGFIDWSWLWVLAPFWLGPAFVLLVLFIFTSLVAAAALISNAESRKRSKIRKDKDENI